MSRSVAKKQYSIVCINQTEPSVSREKYIPAAISFVTELNSIPK